MPFSAEFDAGHYNKKLRQATRTGRPAGDERFVERIETLTGRDLNKRTTSQVAKAIAVNNSDVSPEFPRDITELRSGEEHCGKNR